ncbi:MAG: protein translocase subunit SecD [Phyllobacterium sp.]
MLYFTRWKTILIWLVVLGGVILALPTFIGANRLAGLPDWFPKRQVQLGLDLEGGSRFLLQPESNGSANVDASINALKRRVYELGIDETQIRKEGNGRIRVEIAGLQDPELLKDILGEAGKISFHMLDTSMAPLQAIESAPPEGSTVVYSADDLPVPYVVKSEPIVSNDNLADVQAGIDTGNQQAVITFQLDTAATERFAKVTQDNVNGSFAIVFDDQVISIATIEEPITDGVVQITGGFDLEGASNFSALLRAGALPTPLQIIEERTIAPDLGSDSVLSGRLAALVGVLLVSIFMVLVYGFFGVVAILALFVNVILIVAVLSVVSVPLTLAGMAGIVLTIGMAVDSNVLIFERIREDRRAGHSIAQAIDSGFKRAASTILDANVTTLLAVLILFLLGTGPVRGFAVTVGIGIATTLFTAFTLTRWLISQWLRRTKPTGLPRAILPLIVPVMRIPFMKMRYVTFVASILSGLVIMGLFATLGLNYGADFRGGTQIELESLDGPADIVGLDDRLAELNIGNYEVKPYKIDKLALLSVESQQEGENAEQSVVAKLRAELEGEYEFRRVDVVGPMVSGELAKAGWLALFLSLLVVFGYVWIRFRWQFAVGAVLATIHDVVILIGVFVIFRLPFDLWTIAAILTVVGYSLNDTVVIYDRLRENLKRAGNARLHDVIDATINQTLSRTVLTSVATLLVLVALYAFGGSDLRNFAVTMALGIFIATYSSIFIAGPLLILFKRIGRGGRNVRGTLDVRTETVG